MKKLTLAISTLVIALFALPTPSLAAEWKATTPEGYTPITWVKARGVASFMKPPVGNGYLDYLTVIYLPYTQVKLVASSSERLDWGPGVAPLDTAEVRDWAFSKMVAEKTKLANPDMKFMWNVPFFNVTLPTTDLSLGLKSEDATSPYITSGSRPEFDTTEARRMLIVDNKAGTANITDFDAETFLESGDQAVEGFSPTVISKSGGVATARLFLGVKPGGKELIVYCTQGATAEQASEILVSAGVPLENQLQADGGTSVSCGYNLPGQYFVEPGRTLPHLMGAFPLVYRGTTINSTLNVRKGPGTSHAVIRSLTKGSKVEVYQEKNGWARISNNQEWVLAKYLKKQT